MDPRSWGVRPDEEALDYACDGLVAAPRETWMRGIDVEASAAVTFRWLCQLQAAPYSYDLIDNLGVRSPSSLTPGLDRIEPGRRAMRVFEVADVEAGRSITFVPRSRRPAWFAMTYVALPVDDRHSRIVARVALARRGPSFARTVFAAGDLVMMRHQLQRLAGYAGGNGTAAQDSTGR